MTDGILAHSKNYDIDSVAPNVGDTVLVDGKPLEVYERLFDFEHPGVVTLICASRY
jgi:hypothetical protein